MALAEVVERLTTKPCRQCGKVPQVSTVRARHITTCAVCVSTHLVLPLSLHSECVPLLCPPEPPLLVLLCTVHLHGVVVLHALAAAVRDPIG